MSFEVPPWVRSVPPGDAPKLEKASRPDLTPLVFDAASGYAEFGGRHGYYRTTLSSCRAGDKPCGGGYPCKHMYRLAMMLGLVPGEYESDPSRVKYPRSGVPLPEAVARAEGVSLEAQEFLLRHLAYLRQYHAIEPRRVPPEIQSELEGAKLLIRVDDPPGFQMHPDIDRSSYSLLVYLRRKLAWDSYLSGDMTPLYYPAGAQFADLSLSAGADGGASGEGPGNLDVCYFPDDKVTRLLNAYGCNRCLNGFVPRPYKTSIK